ncbi:hypothetical protein [Acidiphilium angustum]|uniref:hypothetical protein n=1 Tax=Acidiphilium angustum TaxID=523 RepID=UPI00068EAEA2|nr:hypothetical protein [Acidiphilium angustum]
MLFHRKIKGEWKKIYPPCGVWQADKNGVRCGDNTMGSRREYYIDDWPEGWRDLGDCQKVNTNINHNGWYENAFLDSRAVIRGRVLQIPGRKGKPIYIPGIYWTDADGVTIYPLDQHDDPKDCAWRADRYAEIAAEQSREDDAKYRAEQEIDECRETIISCRTSMRSLIREIKQARKAFAPAICLALTNTLRQMRRESHKAWKRIQVLERNYWAAVE